MLGKRPQAQLTNTLTQCSCSGVNEAFQLNNIGLESEILYSVVFSSFFLCVWLFNCSPILGGKETASILHFSTLVFMIVINTHKKSLGSSLLTR